MITISVSTTLSTEELADLLIEELSEKELIELVSLISQKSEEGFSDSLKSMLEEVS